MKRNYLTHKVVRLRTQINSFCLFVFLIFLFQTFNSKATDTLIFKTKFLPKPDTVLIFTPKSYFPKDSVYPAVYLLHGYGGDYRSFSELLDLQGIANQYGFLIICPDGLTETWYLNSPVKANSQFETFIFKELWPEINRNYAIDTANIFISGYSMGGHGALYLFLRNHQKFRAAASSSGTLDLNASSLKFTSIASIVGNYNLKPELFTQYSAINFTDSIKFSEKAIFVDCGCDDHLLEANKKFNDKCEKDWISIQFMTMKGRHNDEYWEKSFPWHFYFFKRQIKR